MSNKKSIEASVINSILTLSLLTSCNGSVVNVDKDVVNKLKTEDPNLGQIAESNINHITQVCTEKVDGFISGSENILQIGASAAWSFCDYKDSEGINRRMVVSNQEIGKDENVILLPMRQTADGKSAGFKDADGNDHYIWAENSDGSQTIVFDFNENQYVLNNDEKQQLSDFVAHLTNVTENVSAAEAGSLPELRPTPTNTPVPTETVVPTETPVPESPAFQNARVELGKFIIDDLNNYQITETDGVVKIYGVKENKDIFVDGAWDLEFFVKNINPEGLAKSNIKPINGDFNHPSDEAARYANSFYQEKKIEVVSYLGFTNTDDSKGKLSATPLLLYEFPDGFYSWSYLVGRRGQTLNCILYERNNEIFLEKILGVTSDSVIDFYKK
jgi:hypothetical protein